ncbi:hypothetical protein H9P43_008149 [Blastocladiella emersonii ATCC 22665]|nr:hypothetical protein H9P43_008149 [Blastocladiella emersonii ATCC 22665]
MGVRDLLPLIRTQAPHLYRPLRDAGQLRGRTLAVDGQLFLHRFWFGGAKRLSFITDEAARRRFKPHVQCLFDMLEFADAFGIKLLFVFDGERRLDAKLRVAHVQRAAARDRQIELLGFAAASKARLVEAMNGAIEAAGAAAGGDGLVQEPLADELSEQLEALELRQLNRSPVPDTSPLPTADALFPRLVGEIRIEDAEPRLEPATAESLVGSEPSLTPGDDEIPLAAEPTGADALPWTDPVLAGSAPPEEIPLDAPPSTEDVPPSTETETAASAEEAASALLKSSREQLREILHQSVSARDLEKIAASQVAIESAPGPSSMPGADVIVADVIASTGRANVQVMLRDVLAAEEHTPETLAAAVQQFEREERRLQLTSSGLPSGAVADVLKLLASRRIPFMFAPPGTEGEQVCGALVHLGHADLAVSDDTDTALFFPQVPVLREFFRYNKRPHILGPVAEDLHRALGLQSFASLIDLCVLCGCDYSGKIAGVGRAIGLKLLREHGSIEAVLDAKPNLRAKCDETMDAAAARAVFANEFLDLAEVDAAAKAAVQLTRDADLDKVTEWEIPTMPGEMLDMTATETQVIDAYAIQPFDLDRSVEGWPPLVDGVETADLGAVPSRR